MSHKDLLYSYKHYNHNLRFMFKKYKLEHMFPALEHLIHNNITYDANLYAILHKAYNIACNDHPNKAICEAEFDDLANAQLTVQNITTLFQTANIQPQITTYLDIGSATGRKSSYIGTQLHAKQILCLDIQNDEYKINPHTQCKFQYYDGIHPPYAHNTVDLITSFMVIHHVPKNNLPTLLTNLHNTLTPNGLFIISEHDSNHNLAALINNQHDLILSVKKDYEFNTIDKINERNYMSYDELKQIFEQNGFKLLANMFINNPTKNYLALYQRVN